MKTDLDKENGPDVKKKSEVSIVVLHTHVTFIRLSTGLCRNISGHALMGRPDARLEKMVLVRSSYVLVCIVGKRR